MTPDILLFTFFAILQLLDFYTTWVIFRNGGDDIPDEEQSPHMRKLMERFGVRQVLTLKTIVAIGGGFALITPAMQPYGFYGLCVLVIWYSVVIHHNWKSMS